MPKSQRLVKRLIDNLLSFDQFGSPVNLSVKNETTHKTFMGAIASLGIVILVIFSFVSLIYDMLYNQAPTVVSKQKYDPDPKVFNLNPKNYLLGITVTDNYGTPIVQNEAAMIYQTRARHCFREFDKLQGFKSNCTSLDLVPCSGANIDPKLLTDLQIDPSVIQSFQCMDTKQWEKNNFAYQGTGISALFQTMNLRIYPCVNNTVKNQGFKICIQKVCASPSVINASLNNGFAGIIMPNYLLNQKSGDDPYTSSFKLIQTSLTNTLLTFMEIYLQPSNTTTAYNFFHYFGSENVHSKLLFSRQDQSFQQIPQDGVIGSFVFLLDDQRVDYYFSYYDIFSVLANIGGLANILMLLGNIFIKPLSKLSLDLFLVNQIYTFEKSKQQKNKSQSKVLKEAMVREKKKNSIIFLQKYSPGKVVPQNFLSDINANVAWLKQIFKQKIVKARFTVTEYICQCYPGPKAKLIKNGVDKIYEKLDSLYIIRKLIEIDKLKALLLNDQQIKLFEQLPKPSLSQEQHNRFDQIKESPNASIKELDNDDNPQNTKFDIFHRKKPFMEELSEVFEAYLKISENPDELDRKLLSLLDKDVLSIFYEVANSRSRKIIQYQIGSPQNSAIESLKKGRKDSLDVFLIDQPIEVQIDSHKTIVPFYQRKKDKDSLQMEY